MTTCDDAPDRASDTERTAAVTIPATPDRGINRRTLFLLLAVLVLLAFAFQGTRGIWEPDEGRYSSAGINMYESGDWLIPTVDGEHPHLTKPPMIYWALASSFTLLGPNEWAARLPGALAYIGTGLFVFGLGRRLCASRPWLPAVVWALSLAPLIAANIVSTDPLLTFFETAAMYAFVEAWSRRGGTGGRGWYLLMWVGWGLAFMTKGPPGLLPLFGMLLFLGLHDPTELRRLLAPAGVVAFLGLASAWFAVVILQEPDRLQYFVGYEVYDRVFTAAHDRNAQWYGAFEVYLPVLIAGTLPWSLLAVVAAGGPRPAWQALRQRFVKRNPDWLLLAYWLLVPLTIFFLARSRLQLYVLPLFVPIALILARPLARWSWFEGRRAAWVLGTTAVVLLGLKGALAYWPSDRDSRELAAQLEHMVDAQPVDEIVFVGMRPFYGLNVYMDRHIEGIEIGEHRFDYSKFVHKDDLCDEVAERERAIYGVKERRAEHFLDALGKCGGRARLVGEAHADGSRLLFYAVTVEASGQISR